MPVQRISLLRSPARGVSIITAELRRKYRNADHICSGVRFRDEMGMLHEDWKNDGEVGCPGMALPELLRAQALERHMSVVVYSGESLRRR
ncbi:MAG TPA: hypothetical protein ENN44_07190 [Methanoculleus sp.]|nr:hypothetical protein [Methanoculleus sp.]